MSEKYFDTIHQNHLKVILFNWTPEMEIWQENPHLHPTINTKTAHIIRPSGIKQAPQNASLWEANAMFLETCSYHTSIISTEGRLSVSPQYTCPTGKAVAFSRVAGFAFWFNRERERVFFNFVITVKQPVKTKYMAMTVMMEETIQNQMSRGTL